MIDLIINFDEQNDKKKLFDVLKILAGKKVIKIETYRQKRSFSQNNYYWGVVLRYFSDATGYTTNEAHDVLKEKFLPKYEKANKKTGELEIFSLDTKSLKTLEFEEYLEKIRTLSLNELDCLIPLPNEAII